MAFDRTAGGHSFDELGGTCTKCGLSWKRYSDNGKPVCRGKPAEKPKRQFADED
jgi:hypothetical protein